MLFISFPAREDEGQVVSMKPPSFQTSMTGDRYTPCTDTAKVSQRGTRPVASHQSSLTSLEECGPTGRLPRNALPRPGGSHTEVSVLVAGAQKTSWCVSSVLGRCSPWPFSCVTLLVCHCSCSHKPAHQCHLHPVLLPELWRVRMSQCDRAGTWFITVSFAKLSQG